MCVDCSPDPSGDIYGIGPTMKLKHCLLFIIVILVNRWCRARVDELLEGDRVLLFFVDYGDNAPVNIDDTTLITEMQIKKLPFQVSTDF